MLKAKYRILFLILTGISICFIVNILISEKPVKHFNRIIHLTKNLVGKRSFSDNVQSIRVLCLVVTEKENYQSRAIHSFHGQL